MGGVGWWWWWSWWWWCGNVHQVDGGGCSVVRSVGLVVGRRIGGAVGWVVSKYIKEQEYLKYCLFLEKLILVIELLKKVLLNLSSTVNIESL